jgi:predicted Zn finger-like uncharacterized protein
MYTQCPECLSVFSLDAATLAQAHGHVICGHCEAGFDSFATLAGQLPPEPFRELPINQQAMLPPRIELVVYRPHDEPPAVIASESPAPLDAEDFSQLVFAPKFVRKQAKGRRMRRQQRRSKRRAGWRHGLWVLLCSVLALLLGAQLAWAERSVLIRDPLVGHWLRNTCQLLGCRLPLVAAPQLLQLLDSNVQAHPGVAHALMISASVRNDAAFAQPYPVLGITLSDAQGQRLAMRRLQPRDYLDDPAALARGLAPGATTVLLLEVNDPGDKAVAFEFNFQ